MNEDLRKWFGKGKDGDWVRVGTDGKIKGDCAREPGEGKPKCMPRSKAHSMGKDDRATAARRKRREDPDADRKGKPIMVNTEEFMLEKNQPTNPSLWSKAKSLARQKFDVYPSAYANGWASKYYKSKGGSWKTVSEEALDEAAAAGLAAKADKSGISIGVLRKVYNRGMAAWKTGHRPGTTPQQWAMARVNSYIGKGSGTYHGADKDLREVAKDAETGLPKKYVSGLSKSTSKARAAHFAANDKLSDSNPAAYKPAPGDANAKTKPSKHTMKYRAMYGEEAVDEACWSGYKRVGMKKKGNKMVPNCVPEATDIIAKAKAAVAKRAGAKLKMDPDTGTPDHFTAAQRRKKGLDEALTRVTSGNKGYGYHGTVEARDDAEKDKRYSAMHRYAKKLVGDAGHLQDAKKPNVMVKHFLDSPHGRHIADNPTDKNITSRFSEFKKKYKPEMHEEVELAEENHYTVHKAKEGWHVNQHTSNGVWNHSVQTGYHDSKQKAVAWAKNHAGSRAHKIDIKEELGKSNEWGTDALRKKYAAMTPGQESMAADKIPSFDPRYDDVTTQYCGGIREGYLAEISARASELRAKFQSTVRKTLADPANIKRAKKTIAKRKEAEKAKEAPHLVMQLRKAVSIGSKVHFQDGQHHAISSNHADIFMSKYNSAKSSIEKEALQKRAHKSHSEFMKTIAEGVHEDCGTSDCCQTCDTSDMGTHHVDSYEAHKGSGDQISPVISHDDEDIRFQDFDEEAFEKELEADVLALSWDDMVDLYDEDELDYVEDYEEDLEEGITPQGRLKKRFNAMRSKSRRNMARNLALKRVSTPERIKSRSIRTARRMVYKRLLRNRDPSTVSAAEKTRFEAQIKRLAPMVARISMRVIPAVRKLERSRIAHGRTRKR